MSIIKITGAALWATVRFVTPKIGRMAIRRGIINRIRQRLASWQNADSEAFMVRCEQLSRDLYEMEQCLEDYCRLLESSARDYEATQERIKHAANTLVSARGR